MSKMTNASELIKPEENVKEVFNGTRGLIKETGDYAEKNRLPSCMSFSMYCILGYLVFMFLVLICPIEFPTKVIGIIAATVVIIIIIYMTFEMNKDEIRIQHRYKKDKN